MKIKINKYWTVLETTEDANYDKTYVACKPSFHANIDIDINELEYLRRNDMETYKALLKTLHKGVGKGDMDG